MTSATPADESAFSITLLDAAQATWSAKIAQLSRALGGANNPTLLPYHFLQATLPRIGGRVALVHARGELAAAGLLFPRMGNAYTLRYHTLRPQAPGIHQVADLLAGELIGMPIIPYDPLGKLTYTPTHHLVGVVDIGRPAREEAAAIRALQQQVWGSTAEFLYPADLHSAEFGLGTSLIARMHGQPAGFLFGFLKFNADPLPADWATRFNGALRVESQALGVAPEYRGARIGSLLKQVQAEQARQQGIHIINWTVDPLQWPNAVLNFGRLRALAFHFTPDYYPFRNELNRVTASRFSLTWLVSSGRVRQALHPPAEKQESPPTSVLDLKSAPEIVRVNDGWQRVRDAGDAARIAIEIPADWTALQRDDLDGALRWRTASDEIFAQLIGLHANQYVVNAVGIDGERRYLVADRVCNALWVQYGAG